MMYDDAPFEERIDRVATHGFDTVEFWTWPDKDIDAIEARLAEYDLSLAAFSSSCELGVRPEELTRALTDPATQDAAIEDIERSIEMATRLDCPTLIVLVGPTTPSPDDEVYESVVDGLRAVAPTAEATGVTLAVEPLNTAVDHEGYFLEDSHTGYSILRDVDSPAVTLLFDVYHQQITEGNIIENLTAHVDLIGHVHVADVPGRHEPGTGELHYENILTALDDAGYEGRVGFEFAPAGGTDRALESVRDLVSE